MKTLGRITALVLFSTIFLLSIPASAQTLKSIPDGAPIPANRFVELAKLINPTVVNISTSQTRGLYGHGQIDPRDPFFNFLEQFMGRGLRPPNPKPATSLGTGFIIREDGLIITNNHVIDRADVIQVQLSEGGKLYEAEVIGKDQRTDLALIKIKAGKKLPAAKLGTSQDLQVGEWVAAFGNPFGHGHSMSKGIISAKGRSIDELNRFPFIQTDASINPGNSGGPLVNINGEVVGVNTAIDARAQGIGFAIPVDDVKSIIKILEKDGQITRGYLGVYLSDIDEENAKSLLKLDTTEGAVVTQVQEGTPAAKAGIKPYDFIFQVNNHKVRSSGELIRRVADLSANEKAVLHLYRNGKKKKVKVTLGQHPDQVGTSRGAKNQKSESGLLEHGMGLSQYSEKLRRQFDLPKLKKGRPVIVKVQRGTSAYRAGLAPGDVILDVNKKPVYSVRAAKRQLNSKNLNLLRILRGEQVFLVYLRP